METFDAVWAEHKEKLSLYVPVVDRVHGDSHPEFHQVRALFDALQDVVAHKKATDSDVAEIFEGFRRATNGYEVPEDVCESYEAVYDMLAELDQALGS